jgi:hypothetical protein
MSAPFGKLMTADSQSTKQAGILDRFGYDILLRPGFPSFDLAFDRRTRQILNKSLW